MFRMNNFYGILSANRTVILSASEESYRQRSKILHFVQECAFVEITPLSIQLLLGGVELVVKAFPGQQLLVVSCFHNFAAFQSHDPVGIPHG